MKILLLTGAPGVGKSTIAHLLSKDDRYNLIKSYTDRPQRENEYDHEFLSEDELTNLIISNTISAYTRIDGYRYCSLRKQFDPEKINIYVVDVHGINDTISAFPMADYMSILITRKNIDIDQIRKNRNVHMPSRNQVNFTIDNDDDSPNSAVNVIKFLTLYENGRFFDNYHDRVMTMSEEIELLEYRSQRAWDEAQKLRRELDVYTQEIDDA